MHSLASLILRGRAYAVLIVLIFTILGLPIPLLSYFSSATMALVTLRKGVTDGLLLLAASSGMLLVLTLALSETGAAYKALASTTGANAMLIVVALVLRQTRSLPMSLAAGSGLSATVVLGALLIMTDASGWWRENVYALSTPWMESAATVNPEDAEQRKLQIDHIAGYIGYFGAGVLVNLFLSLFLARWWQALVVNPGGFRAEFHALRMPKVVTFLASVLALLVLLDISTEMNNPLAANLLLIMAPLYLLQGLAVMHAIVALKKVHWVWLVPIYFLTFAMLPVVIVLGYVDHWIDLRSRLGGAGQAT